MQRVLLLESLILCKVLVTLLHCYVNLSQSLKLWMSVDLIINDDYNNNSDLPSLGSCHVHNLPLAPGEKCSLQKSCRGRTTCKPRRWLPLRKRWWRDFWLQAIRQNKTQRAWLTSFILLNQIASFITFTHTIQGKCLSTLQRWAWASLSRFSSDGTLLFPF